MYVVDGPLSGITSPESRNSMVIYIHRHFHLPLYEGRNAYV